MKSEMGSVPKQRKGAIVERRLVWGQKVLAIYHNHLILSKNNTQQLVGH